MATVEHVVVKAEKIVQTAAVALAENLVLPAVFQREGIDQFKGAKDDTINITVPGVLPFRTYGWRNDRTTELQFDSYSERKYPITFGDDIYSGVKLTDEQSTMDIDGWAKLVTAQTDAVGRGLEFEAADYVKTAPIPVTLGVADTALRAGLIRARATLNSLRAPGRRTLIVGTDWESALLNDDNLNLAQNVGEGEAVSSLREATLGRRYGFDIVVSQELAPDIAIAMVDSAFIFTTAAPAVPASASFGATAAYDGIALRWVKDFEIKLLQELSVINAYKGFRHIVDPLLGVDQVTGQASVSTYEHFVRAIKLDLNGADSLPNGSTGRTGENALFTAARDNELATITGIGTAV